MSSPNLAAPHVAAAQNQKEVTINDATDALDLALTASAVIECTDGGTIAVPLATARRALRLVLTGAPDAGFDLTLPNLARALILRNGTDQPAQLRMSVGGAVVDLPPGAERLVYGDGLDVHLVGPVLPPRVYDFGMLANDTPAPDAVLGKLVIPRALILPAGLAGAQAHVDTPPEAPFEITLTRDGMSIGSITIAPDGSAGFTSAGDQPVEIAPGQVIRFLAPSEADATITGIAVTLTGALA